MGQALLTSQPWVYRWIALSVAWAILLTGSLPRTRAGSISNDACTDAPLVGEGGAFGSTVGATADGAGQCGDSGSSPDVWYAVTNPRDCEVEVTASTCDAATTFDTVLAAFDSCGGDQVACNDDDPQCDIGDGRQSTIAWTMPPGATHYVRVSGYQGEVGDFALTISTPAANSRCQNAILIADAALLGSTLCNLAHGTSFCDTPIVAGPLPPPISASASTEYSDTFAVSNLFDGSVDAADLNATSYGTNDGQYAALGDVDGPYVEVFLDFGETISAAGIAYSQRVGGIPTLDKVGEIKIWFSDVDFGATLPADAPDADVIVSDTTDAVLRSYLFGGTRTGRFVALQLISATPDNPGNIGGSEMRLLTLSTRSPTAWYAYTNPYSTPVYMSATTCSPYTNYDTTLSVFDACAGFEIGCNDDAFCPSSVHASALDGVYIPAGATYRLRVSGANSEAGDFDLNVSSVAANNDCHTPVQVSDGQPLAFHTFGTDTDGPIGTQQCVGETEADVRADIWFRYTGSCNGHALTLLCDSDFDTEVAIYDGAACPTGATSSVACNDDACGPEGYASAVAFPTSVGTTSLIQVGGWQGAQGEGRIEVLCFKPGDFDQNQTVDLADHIHFIDCMSGPGEVPQPSIPGVLQARCLAAFDLDADGDVDLADGAHVLPDIGGPLER